MRPTVNGSAVSGAYAANGTGNGTCWPPDLLTKTSRKNCGSCQNLRRGLHYDTWYWLSEVYIVDTCL